MYSQNKEKVNNLVLFDKPVYEKLLAEVPKYKVITPVSGRVQSCRSPMQVLRQRHQQLIDDTMPACCTSSQHRCMQETRAGKLSCPHQLAASSCWATALELGTKLLAALTAMIKYLLLHRQKILAVD